ncbi:MAG: helix-turn-helix transcriptional regulator [Ignavibacteriae bacterium]|nr:helix-turn-helix transcriptional regulator [Ignavibacteriota bacterium]
MPRKHILHYIQKNYRNPVFNINSLHNSTHESASYNRFVFKEEHGCSLHDMLEILRVADALVRLSENKGIESIYKNAGFATPKTLRDAFRRRFGCSPSECRALLVKATDKELQLKHLLRKLCADNDKVHSIVLKSLENVLQAT